MAGRVTQLPDAAGLNFVYYLRAKTEERHLSRYPEFREYLAWMEQHAPITQFFMKWETKSLASRSGKSPGSPGSMEIPC